MAGLPWFALATDFPEHPKTRRLALRLRDHNAGMYVVRLLAFCAAHAPTGRLDGESVEAIVEMACEYRGKRQGALIEALETCGFIERDGDGYRVHGWEERNGAHVRKREKDNAKPNASRRKPAQTPREPPANPARGLGGNGAGEREVQGEVEGHNGIATGSGTDDIPPPGSRPARIGLGSIEYPVWEHWRSVAWPSLSSEPCLAATQRDAAKLRDLCNVVGVEAVKAAMDRAVADPWWRQPGKLDLSSFLFNFPKFTQRNEAPAKPVKVLA